MKKAMLSQPMAGKTDEEIVATREKAIKVLEEKGYEVVNTLFTDEWYSIDAMKKRGVVQIPICYLAKSLENMSLCHAAYFCKGWENARGCKIEHDTAVAYGLDIIYEEQSSDTNIKIKEIKETIDTPYLLHRWIVVRGVFITTFNRVNERRAEREMVLPPYYYATYLNYVLPYTFFVTSFLIRINHLLIGSIKCCKSVPKLNKSNSIPLYN